MTIDQFASNNGIKRKKVEKWINDGLIPRADLAQNYVPDSARQPYTNARAKNTDSIYKSMIIAAQQRKHILPKLYKISEDEFNGYINRLVTGGYLVRRESDGVEYYDATIESSRLKTKGLSEIIEAASRGISEGMTNAFLNNGGR